MTGKTSHNDLIASGLDFLRLEQAKNGCFYGQVSALGTDFSKASRQPTTFFSSLVGCCLAGVPDSQPIVDNTAVFLQSEASTNWSWNYWLRGSDSAVKYPYPDDLDDTACAVAAITQSNKNAVSASNLAAFARQLIACERSPGGPYNTWLVDADDKSVWHDTDVAVNANICYALSLHDTRLVNLEAFLQKSVENNQLTSKYYINPIAILYFITRCNIASLIPLLQSQITQLAGHRQYYGNPLLQAMLLSSGCRLRLPAKVLGNCATRLKSLQLNGHWSASALYYEPSVDNQPRYAGSASLTTAFAVEALQLHMNLQSGSNFQKSSKTIPYGSAFKAALLNAQTIPVSTLRRDLIQQLKNLSAQDSSQQISSIATITAKACSIKLSQKQSLLLNQASIYGWLAYTIYDDFLDDEGQPKQLSTAHYAARAMLHCFKSSQTIKHKAAFGKLVDDILTKVDIANSWELHKARGCILNGNLHIQSLPIYKTYQQLAHRSLGHCLASCGVLLIGGYNLDSPQVRAMQRFFYHYLIARQLNDDAHDWEVDLQNGHMSAIVVRLLNDYGRPANTLDIIKNLPELRRTFWNTTMLQVANDILTQTALAKGALKNNSAVYNYAEYQRWLDHLNSAANTALAKCAETKQFIAAFNA